MYFFLPLYSLGRNLHNRNPKPLPKPTVHVERSEVEQNNDNIVEEHFTVDADGNIIGNYRFMLILNISGEYFSRIFVPYISAKYFSEIFICSYLNIF